jgi:flavin-dependent dehydrogenase
MMMGAPLAFGHGSPTAGSATSSPGSSSMHPGGGACWPATRVQEEGSLFSQVGIYSWFKNLEPHPPGYEGMLFLHFLNLERAWAWQIPMRNGVSSIGVVIDKADFRRPGVTNDEFFDSLMQRNATLRHNMRNAERIRAFSVDGDYSYKVEKLAGEGLLLIGDALRFVDPVFSTGVDVASYSALYAFETINQVFNGDDEKEALGQYERRIGDGVEAWYDLIALFYKLPNLFTAFAVNPRYREMVVRILQGNLYIPESGERAREIIAMMERSYEQILGDATNLLRPGALSPEVRRPSPSSEPAERLAGSRQ